MAEQIEENRILKEHINYLEGGKSSTFKYENQTNKFYPNSTNENNMSNSNDSNFNKEKFSQTYEDNQYKSGTFNQGKNDSNSLENTNKLQDSSKLSLLPSQDEFNYILLKNLQAYDVTLNILDENVFKNLPNYKNNGLTVLVNRLSSLIKIDNDQDKSLIFLFFSNIFQDDKEDMIISITEFIREIAKNIKIYSPLEIKKLKVKVKKHYKGFYKNIKKKIASDDNKSNSTSIFKVKELLGSLDVVVNTKYTEYLIYLMKKSMGNKNGIYSLNLDLLDEIFNNDDYNKDIDSSLEENISNFQYDENERITEILLYLSKYINDYNSSNNSQSTLRSFFKMGEELFRPENEEGKELDICIHLDDFMSFLVKIIKFNVSEYDKRTIFERYHLDEEFQVISIELIEKDLLQISNSMTFSKTKKDQLNIIPEHKDEKYDSDKKFCKYYYNLIR